MYPIRQDFTFNIIYSIIIGLIVGFAAVLFHNSIEFFNEIFFTQPAKKLSYLGSAIIIFLPAFGMLIQSIMILLAPEYAKDRGVTEVIKSVAFKGSRIPLRSTLYNFIASVISIGSGNTVGPEGPAARLGGGIANKLSFLLKVSETRRSVLTAAGAGAAISAIFNAPMGGIFFAFEIVLLNEFSTTSFPILIISSVTASAVSRTFLGNKSVFVFQSPTIGNYLQLYHYALLGILAGIISIAFVTYSDMLNKFFKTYFIRKIPKFLLMIFVGLLVGISGYFYKYIFGIGYDGINQILSNTLSWQIVAVLLILKFMLVPLVLNSGGFGGIFAPSLFIGAALGYLYGFCLNYISGSIFDITPFVLVGMGAVLGGINFIPISAILLIFEMTKDYSFILPLMLSVVTSTMIVQFTLKKSIHERYLEQQGYRVSTKREINIDSLPIKHVMKNEISTIRENTPITNLIREFVESKRNTFYLIDETGKIVGSISVSDLRTLITEYENVKSMLVAKDVATDKIIVIKEDEKLGNVMKLFETLEQDEFPVVSSSDNKILGTISKSDVISAYNKEKLKSELLEQLSHNLIKLQKSKKIKIFEGYSIAEFNVPQSFVGKTLSQLEIRKKYNLEVIMVKRNNDIYFPSSDYIVNRDDILILFGNEENIEKVEKNKG